MIIYPLVNCHRNHGKSPCSSSQTVSLSEGISHDHPMKFTVVNHRKSPFSSWLNHHNQRVTTRESRRTPQLHQYGPIWTTDPGWRGYQLEATPPLALKKSVPNVKRRPLNIYIYTVYIYIYIYTTILNLHHIFIISSGNINLIFPFQQSERSSHRSHGSHGEARGDQLLGGKWRIPDGTPVIVNVRMPDVGGLGHSQGDRCRKCRDNTCFCGIGSIY